MKKILSNQTDRTADKFGLVKSVSLIAQAGFDAVDVSMFVGESTDEIYSDNYKQLVSDMLAEAKNSGVYFNQAHAPFPSYRVGDEEYNKMIAPKLERSIEFAGLLGVENLVIHPVYYEKDCKERNLEMYNGLAPLAKNAGVHIAVENMWGRDNRRRCIVPNVCSVPADLADYYDSLDPEVFTVCLDLGHCPLVGEDTADFIRYLGHDRLGCLHIHSNNFHEDSHLPPFVMEQDFYEIARALKEIDYKGDFTLEADNLLRHLPGELYPSALRFMHDTGRHLIKLVETL